MAQDNETGTERKMDSVLKYMLNNDRGWDVTLEGNDGVQVHANRAVLAARSEPFEKMFFGGFQESSVVKLDYSGDVISAIVQYCYTNDYSLNGEWYRTVDIEELAVTIASLTKAADYFELFNLQRNCFDTATDMIGTHPTLSFVFFQEAPGFGKLETYALWYIRATLPDLLAKDDDALSYVQASRMESLLTDDMIEVDDYRLFLLLKAWVDADDEGDRLEKLNRQKLAQNLLDYIRLENIAHSDLETTVKQSGLVSSDQLADAYKKQASLPYTVTRRTSLPVWKRSQEPTSKGYVDTPECEAMKSCIHKWKLFVSGPNVGGYEVGVVADFPWWKPGGQTANNIDSRNRSKWSYISNGYAIFDGEQKWDFPKYDRGSVISLTLDLRDPENRTLSASINDGETFCLFANMKVPRSLATVQPDGPIGFLPFASHCPVRFLGFQPSDL